MSSTVAVIGLGSIARRHRNNLKSRFPDVRILAMPASGRVVHEQVEHVDQMFSSLQDLINAKPDFAIVASPASLHAAHATALIQVGIPVLVEKPLTSSPTDAESLCEVAAKYQVPVAVGYCLRYLSSAQHMKRILDAGVIGPVYNAFVNTGQYLPQWRTDKDYRQSVSASSSLGGGVLLELSHELDYMQWLLGELRLQFAQLRNSIELGLDVEELADIVLTSASGTVCSIHLDFLQNPPQRHCSFIGGFGSLEWDLLQNTITLRKAEGDTILFAEPDWNRNQMYLAMLDDFMLLIKNREQQCADLYQAAKIVNLVGEIKHRATWGVKL